MLLARKAVKLTSNDSLKVNTLGVAYYRHGDYVLALHTLEGNLKPSVERATAFDYFFLAMCHARLGAASRARAEYDQAVRWIQDHRADIDEQTGWDQELEKFR